MVPPATLSSLNEELARWVERVLDEKGAPVNAQDQITEPFLRTSLDDSLDDRATLPGRLERDDSAVPTDPRGDEDGDSLDSSVPTDVRGSPRPPSPPRCAPTIALEPDPRAARQTLAWEPPRQDSTISAGRPRRSPRRVTLLVVVIVLLLLSPVVAVLLFLQPELVPATVDRGIDRRDAGARAERLDLPRR
jgi:hypothetical protein